MIFLTVGTQLPFDRLVCYVDEWAAANPECEIFAQIGETKYKPSNLNYTNYTTPKDTLDYFSKSQYVISHAGMGSILTALSLSKPIIIIPRKFSLGEHRNDHQLSTCRLLEAKNNLSICHERECLFDLLDNPSNIKTPTTPKNSSNIHLAARVRDFITNT